MWVTGGIGSEHILVIGVTRQCPAEGFYQKGSAPHSGPYSGKFLPRTGGGLHAVALSINHQSCGGFSPKTKKESAAPDV